MSKVFHSPAVQLTMVVAGKSIRLWQIAPNSATLREKGECYPPNTTGRILCRIDDNIKEYIVNLPNGILPTDSSFEVDYVPF